MTKREQLKRNVIQYLQKGSAEIENFDDHELARFFSTCIPDCSPCVFDGRKCNEFCGVRIYEYLKNHGDEEVDQ